MSENETSSFQAMSEKEKTTNKAKELQKLLELNSVAEKPNSSLAPQAKCNSNFTDNELSNSDIEILSNPEISNICKQKARVERSIAISRRITGKQGEKLKSRKKPKLVENRMRRL